MDELKLFHRCRHDAENEVGVLYFLHGLADHFGRWQELKDFLVNKNISFYSHDQRGHGKTELGDRAWIEDLDTFADDTIREIEAVKKEKPDIPIIIMGHSMGGLIAVMVALKRPDLISGSCLSAPCLKIHDSVSPFMKQLAWGLSSLMPKLYMPWNSIDREKLTPNMEQREKDAADPLLWHYGCRAGFAVAMFKAVDEANAKFGDYSTPTYIFHSENDGICDYAGSLKLAETKPDLVKMVRYEYPYHSLLHLMPEDTQKVTNDVYEKILELCTEANKGQ